MLLTTTFFAIVLCGIFAGGANYVSIVEQYARINSQPASALDTFKTIFHRAAKFQIPLLIVSSICALIAWYLSGQLFWMFGAIAMIIIIPFTLIGLMPLNHKLLAAETTSDNLSGMLSLWGKYQLVRTLLANIAFILYVLAAIR
jgi:hypothetical protein